MYTLIFISPTCYSVLNQGELCEDKDRVFFIVLIPTQHSKYSVNGTWLFHDTLGMTEISEPSNLNKHLLYFETIC